MIWALVYGFVSLLIGAWCELEEGDPWENSAIRCGRMLAYAAAWPLLLAGSIWFWLSFDLDDEEFF